MKHTWDDIIESELKEIKLIGYGSILSKHTKEENTHYGETVVVSGFERIYNLKMVPEWFCRSKLEAFMKKYWGKYGIHTMEQVDNLDPKYCVLNAQESKNPDSQLNWVLIQIPRSDFETFKKREEIYDLFPVKYNHINPESWVICEEWEEAFILCAQTQYTIEDGYAFPPYHELCQNGAYSYGEKFWRMFDETTKRVEK